MCEPNPHRRLPFLTQHSMRTRRLHLETALPHALTSDRSTNRAAFTNSARLAEQTWPMARTAARPGLPLILVRCSVNDQARGWAWSWTFFRRSIDTWV